MYEYTIEAILTIQHEEMRINTIGVWNVVHLNVNGCLAVWG